jgi:hypothetical protein
METTGRSADAVNGFSAIIYLVIACAPIYIRTLSPNDCFVSPALSGGSGSWLVPTVVLPRVLPPGECNQAQAENARLATSSGERLRACARLTARTSQNRLRLVGQTHARVMPLPL